MANASGGSRTENEREDLSQWQILSVEEQAKVQQHHLEFITARDTRDQDHDEFDKMPLQKWVEFNAKTAQTFIEPRKNPTDINIITGIPREKMLSIGSNILKLNFEPEVSAFSDSNDQDQYLGKTFTHLVRKSNEMEGDETKSLLRILYLLEQGTICVEEAWTPYTKKRKFWKDRSKLDPATGFQGTEWYTREMTTYHAERRIIDLTSMYFGNIKQFDMGKQPYIFTREVMHIDEARAIYGGWAAWQYVKAGDRKMMGDHGEDDVPYRDFRLYPLEKDQVEVIKYQNIWEDEYQIYINGVMMLPPDMPLPWEWTAEGDEGKAYSITKVVLEPISPFFVYGKSLMSKVRIHAEVLDEMLRMLVHKTKQSIKPPVGNMTGMTLSGRLFDPGVIWDGVNPDKLKSLITHSGVTPSEFQMYGLIQKTVDSLTVNPTFQGQNTRESGTTATEVLEMQRQAQLNLGFVMFAVRLLDEKMNYLRLQNVLENWTKPLDTELFTEIDAVTKQEKQGLRNKYREVSVNNAQLRDRIGTAKIKFIDDVPDAATRRKVSYELLTEERRSKKSEEKMFISLPLLRRVKWSWKVRSNPSERESNDLKRVMFGEEYMQALNFFGPQSINQESYKKKFAQVWGRKFEDVFVPSNFADLQTIMGQRGAGGAREGQQTATQAGGAMQAQVGRAMQKQINPAPTDMIAAQ